MKITLIQLTAKDRQNLAPAGILALGTFIKKHKHSPTLLNVSIPKEGNQPNLYKSWAKKIIATNPEVLGFSVVCNTLPGALLIAKECKRIKPKIPIIFGGPDVNFEEETLLKTFKQVNIIVRGEGEITLRSLLNALETNAPLTGIAGITYRDKTKITRNPDRPFIENLDTLPYLDFSLLPKNLDYGNFQIEGGRGCPYRCTFCSTCKTWKQQFRIKAPGRLVAELKHACSRFTNGVLVHHDNLLSSRKWSDEFLSLLSKEKLSWYCLSRMDLLDEPLIKKLKESGCSSMLIGIESGSEKTQRLIKKNLNLKVLPEILRSLSNTNILCGFFFIIGFPWETKREINDTLMTAIKTKIYTPFSTVAISLLSLMKGSELYYKMKNKLRKGQLLGGGTSPFLSNSGSEKLLIKKYPELFPSFYFIKNPSIDPEFLQELAALYRFFANYFPATALLLLKTHKLSPYQLGEKIISFSDSLKTKTNLKYPNSYLELFRSFLKKEKYNSSPAIKNVFDHEVNLTKASVRSKVPRNGHTICDPGIEVKPKRRANIKKYNCNIDEIIEDMRNNRSCSFNKKPTYFAYIGGHPARTLPLTASDYTLLKLCNGKRSLKDIIMLICGKNIKIDTALKQSFLRAFKSLKKYSLIR